MSSMVFSHGLVLKPYSRKICGVYVVVVMKALFGVLAGLELPGSSGSLEYLEQQECPQRHSQQDVVLI